MGRYLTSTAWLLLGFFLLGLVDMEYRHRIQQIQPAQLSHSEPSLQVFGLLLIWGMGGALVVCLVALLSRDRERDRKLRKTVEQRTRELNSQKDQLLPSRF